MDRQDYQRALPYLGKASELSPDSSIDHYNLGLVFLNLGNADDAKTQLEAAIA